MMFPRLAFVTLANNLMVLSIRSMLTEFFCKLIVHCPMFIPFGGKLMISPNGSRGLLLSRSAALLPTDVDLLLINRIRICPIHSRAGQVSCHCRVEGDLS